MAMNFEDEDGEVMSEINMTPLVDVMLVLLIIFLITAPVLKHAVRIDLPKASQQPLVTQPKTVVLSVMADGQYVVDEQPVSDAALPSRLQGLRQTLDASPEPQLQIHGDKAVAYERVARAMAVAQRTGWHNLAFATDRELASP